MPYMPEDDDQNQDDLPLGDQEPELVDDLEDLDDDPLVSSGEPGAKDEVKANADDDADDDDADLPV
jgi:hypothetical protein